MMERCPIWLTMVLHWTSLVQLSPTRCAKEEFGSATTEATSKTRRSAVRSGEVIKLTEYYDVRRAAGALQWRKLCHDR